MMNPPCTSSPGGSGGPWTRFPSKDFPSWNNTQEGPHVCVYPLGPLNLALNFLVDMCFHHMYLMFWVLFREWGILSFFSCRKNNHPLWENSAFLLQLFLTLWVCVPLFGLGGPVFKVCTDISKLGMCCDDATSRVKIPHFCYSYFWLMCVCDTTQQELCGNSVFSLQLFPAYMCVCVCMCMVHDTTESCENSVFSLWLFLAYVCVCLLLCFLFDWAGPALRCLSIAGISESELKLKCVAPVATTWLAIFNFLGTLKQ